MDIIDSEKFDEYAEPFSTGETIFEEGDPGEGFYILRDGTVDVIAEKEGRELVLATLGPGEIFGEMALIGEGDWRTATVKAQTRVIALHFSRQNFLTFLGESGQFREFVLEILAQRVRETNERYKKMGDYAAAMLDSTHLMLALMDQLDWYAEAKQEVDVAIPEDLVRKKFDLDKQTAHQLLSIEDSTELSRFPSHVQDDLLDAAERILDTGFSKLDIEFSASQYDASRSFGGELKSINDLLKATKQLTSILNNSDRLTRSQYRKIYDQHRKLRERFEDQRVERSGGSDSRTVHQLKAHLDALGRKLKEFDLHELEEDEG